MPKTGPGRFDTESVGIKSAMNAPKSGPYVNEQIRPGGKATFDADALAIRGQMADNVVGRRKESTTSNGSTGDPAANGDHGNNSRQWGRFDSSALHIQHALKATEVQRKYSKPPEKPIEDYLVRSNSWLVRDKHVKFCKFASNVAKNTGAPPPPPPPYISRALRDSCFQRRKNCTCSKSTGCGRGGGVQFT